MKSLITAILVGAGFSTAISMLYLMEKTERERMEEELESWEANDREWMDQLFEQRQQEFEEQVRRKQV